MAEPESKCEKRLYKTPKDNAYKAIEYVKQRGTEYLEGVGGDDCTIDILVGDRQFVGDEDAAHYDPNADAIVIKSGNEHNETVMVHEVFHAVSKGRGDIEHGLVYSMDAIYKEGADSEWNYRDASLTRDQVIYRGDTALVVGNAMYRIFKRMGVRQKDEVFRFALEVEREQPTSLGAFRRALVRVAKAKFSEAFQQAVAAVLVEMGINDAPPGTIPESMLQFIVAKMRALALKSNGDEAAWAGRAAAEAMREIRRRLGLDDDQVLRSRPRRGG